MSFLPLTDPGHAIILAETGPFVADTIIDWDSVVTKGDDKECPRKTKQEKEEIL
jgi:hypothetical protein